MRAGLRKPHPRCAFLTCSPFGGDVGAARSYKPAKVDTGATILVPPYVDVGDKIVVNVVEPRFMSRER